MTIKSKTPDRIYITKKARSIIDKIDSIKFINLDSTNTSRSNLFSYAMSLGLETIPTKLENLDSGGLILDSSLDSKTKALIYAYIISSSKDKVTLDELTNKEFVYSKVQELANTGFEIIEDEIENSNEENIIWQKIEELDKQYSTSVDNSSNYSYSEYIDEYVAESPS